MTDCKLHQAAKKRRPSAEDQVIKISPEAYNALVDLYNETNLSFKHLASKIILWSTDKIVFDKVE